jgi:hypothetical protein
MEADSPPTKNKVAAILERHGLEEFGEWMADAWAGKDVERHSLRELKDEFNKRVLKAHIEAAGESFISSDIDTAYEILTTDKGTSGERVQKRRDLERLGLDFEEIRDEFVTHQTIHNYLTDVRGLDFDEASYEDQLERNIETLQRLQSRMDIVTENTIDRMCDADRDVGEKYNILVDVRVVCRFCDNQYPAVELIQQGGCPCDQ